MPFPPESPLLLTHRTPDRRVIIDPYRYQSAGGPVPGMALWLKASSLALADSDPVATWPDLSGNGNDATQASSGARPLFKSGILNGKGVVRFDGVDDQLVSACPSSIAQTVLIVARKQTAPSVPAVLFSITGQAYYTNPGNSPTAYVYYSLGGSSAVVGATAANWNVLALLYAPSSLTFFANSLLTMSGDPGSSYAGLGWSFGSDGANFGDYDIAEILIYPTALSDPDREAVEAYLMAEYGL